GEGWGGVLTDAVIHSRHVRHHAGRRGQLLRSRDSPFRRRDRIALVQVLRAARDDLAALLQALLHDDALAIRRAEGDVHAMRDLLASLLRRLQIHAALVALAGFVGLHLRVHDAGVEGLAALL